MDVGSFVASLRQLDARSIDAAAADLDRQASSAAGEVSWWRATVEIDRELRARHAGRLAARAAHQATTAVLRAAAGAGIELPDARVTAVARAAADVARGLSVDAPAAGDLLRGCRHLVAA
ncbi:MAG: hypothetical protein ACYDH6_03500 [Acidimicrobiales bacterium]